MSQTHTLNPGQGIHGNAVGRTVLLIATLVVAIVLTIVLFVVARSDSSAPATPPTQPVSTSSASACHLHGPC